MMVNQFKTQKELNQALNDAIRARDQRNTQDFLAQGAFVHAYYQDPLEGAIVKNDIQAAQDLLAMGYSATSAVGGGFFLAIKKEHVEMVQLLLGLGFDLDLGIQYAVGVNSEKMIDWLRGLKTSKREHDELRGISPHFPVQDGGSKRI